MTRLNFSISFFALIAASLAFAAPKVGDSTTMNGALVGQGVNMKVTTTQTITGYDANTDVYTIHQSQAIGSQAQAKDVQVAGDDMLTEETAGMIVGACESQQIGSSEHIKVSAGEFDTCKVTNNDGSLLWVAPVPFGIVKLQTAIDVGTITIGASNITRGN